MPRGGKRPNSGRKPKSLVDKLADGNVGHRPIKVLDYGEKGKRPVCPDYLKDKANKSGGYPTASEIFEQVCDWLETTGCVHLIPTDYIVEYAMLKSRWMEAEARTDLIGFVTKHPVTRHPITNPMIKAGIEYLKAANESWQKIWKIVAQNSERGYSAETPNDAVMSVILQYGATPPKKSKPPKEVETHERADEHPDDPGQ